MHYMQVIDMGIIISEFGLEVVMANSMLGNKYFVFGRITCT
jgi:hypothetical protein